MGYRWNPEPDIFGLPYPYVVIQVAAAIITVAIFITLAVIFIP